ncbi:MAG TPA: ABC transporter permease [Terracidiphilus sp.]|jgi:predicted permease
MGLFRRILALGRRSSLGRENESELREHMQMRIDANLAKGMSREEAVREARLRFGNLIVYKERVEAEDAALGLDSFFRDMRYALRGFAKSPGFTAVAIVTLALGIGANTAIFSALNAVLLKMLPVRDPQQLYTVSLVNGGTQPPNTSGTGYGNTSFSYPVFQALRQRSDVFADLIAHVPLGYGKVPVRFGDTPTERPGEEVSGNYFSGLGVPMALGAGLTETQEREHSPAAVISYRFWQETFARNADAIGKTLYIKSVPFTIVGVTAPSFDGVSHSGAVDFWIPLQTNPQLNAWGEPASDVSRLGSPKWWDLPMLARLRPGIQPDQAQRILQPTFWQAAGEGAGQLDPKRWPAHLGFDPIRGIPGAQDRYREPLEIMMALVGLVLLIACTNVALLVVARNSARQREFAVRMALGARAARVFRQLLAESSLLVGAGAALGWALAVGATRALAAWARIDSGLAPDWRVLIFTLVLASLSAFAFGLIPMRGTMRIAIEQELKSGSRNTSQNRGRVRSGNAAMALQIAMCLTLLVASSLAVRSLLNYERQDLGMQAESLLVFDVNPQSVPNDAQAFLFYQRLLDRIQAIPGVQAVSLVRLRPGSGWLSSGGITLDGVVPREASGSRDGVLANDVGPGFFQTMGIPLLQGRDIAAADKAGSPLVAVVNEEFARRFLPNGALGHRIDDHPGSEIVGVVKDSKYKEVAERVGPTVYYALAQRGMTGQITVEVRAASSPMALLAEIQRATRELDPNMPLQKPMTQATQFEESYLTPRLFSRLAMGFGLLAAFLVATGIYGTLAYRVQRRKGEIGVRMALGASRASVLRMVLRESLWLALAGFAVGLPLCFAVSRLLRTQLYQLDALDPVSLFSAAAITLFVVLGAALFPARKAASVNPTDALRAE